ncbi:tRNA (5-methylaminomethyl-2-thiouridine)(34)-methyltransferase MnmD [Marinilabiliaceae bacterium ANBcel2]|nr:tRNA (5-methylaminomethyl-2-thiouridine)(34)-methyltransferase MnmD [Marinilabiliaceae bacterium ANBcel2]
MSKDIFNAEIKESKDGSSTLYRADINEHYHSIHGAISESLHVFINSGYKLFSNREQLSILEVGFGTGLNAYLTLLNKNESQALFYHAIEKYPLPIELIRKINYPDILNEREGANLFFTLHNSQWNRVVSLDNSFSLKKSEIDLINLKSDKSYNLIYFDAFAPDKQPEMWSEDLFSLLFSMMSDGGVLVTYCCKGVVRRRLLSVGFYVEKIAGPHGKREMLRAFKYCH